jgi:hypothetical protein
LAIGKNSITENVYAKLIDEIMNDKLVLYVNSLDVLIKDEKVSNSSKNKLMQAILKETYFSSNDSFSPILNSVVMSLLGTVLFDESTYELVLQAAKKLFKQGVHGHANELLVDRMAYKDLPESVVIKLIDSFPTFWKKSDKGSMQFYFKRMLNVIAERAKSSVIFEKILNALVNLDTLNSHDVESVVSTLIKNQNIPSSVLTKIAELQLSATRQYISPAGTLPLFDDKRVIDMLLLHPNLPKDNELRKQLRVKFKHLFGT